MILMNLSLRQDTGLFLIRDEPNLQRSGIILIVALNEKEKKALFAEVKINPQKINPDLLRIKSQSVIHHLNGYKIDYKAFSIEDM
jgi:hypothetical protein